MKLLSFEEYLKKGIAKKQRKDISRSNFLFQEANKSYLGLKQRIEKIGINELNANSIVKDCYDIIMELVRSKMLLEGYSCSGNLAHAAEVSYTEKLGFSKTEIEFLNEARYLRNAIVYYGKMLSKEYTEKIFNFLEKIHPKLISLFGSKKRSSN